MPSGAALAWSAAAGAAGVGGLFCFYAALARGTMGLVAPLAALIGAGLPALVSIAAGERLGDLRLGGIVLGLAAVVLISLPLGPSTPAEQRKVRIDVADLPLVIFAGLGFAGFYLFLDRAAAVGGETWWPLTTVRAAGLSIVVLVIIGALLRGLRRAGSLPAAAGNVFGLAGLRDRPVSAAVLLILFAASGFGDLGGNAFFVLANQADTLPVAVVLSSLYPVVTTILAGIFLHERLRPIQLVGIAAAVIAVALIGVGEIG